MNWQSNYLIARQRRLELVRSAEQARLKQARLKQAHLASSPSSPRGCARWLLTTHRLSATRRAATARQPIPGPPQQGSGAIHHCARTHCAFSAAASEILVVAKRTFPHPDVIDGPWPVDRGCPAWRHPTAGGTSAKARGPSRRRFVIESAPTPTRHSSTPEPHRQETNECRTDHREPSRRTERRHGRGRDACLTFTGCGALWLLAGLRTPSLPTRAERL